MVTWYDGVLYDESLYDDPFDYDLVASATGNTAALKSARTNTVSSVTAALKQTSVLTTTTNRVALKASGVTRSVAGNTISLTGRPTSVAAGNTVALRHTETRTVSTVTAALKKTSVLTVSTNRVALKSSGLIRSATGNTVALKKTNTRTATGNKVALRAIKTLTVSGNTVSSKFVGIRTITGNTVALRGTRFRNVSGNTAAVGIGAPAPTARAKGNTVALKLWTVLNDIPQPNASLVEAGTPGVVMAEYVPAMATVAAWNAITTTMVETDTWPVLPSSTPVHGFTSIQEVPTNAAEASYDTQEYDVAMYNETQAIAFKEQPSAYAVITATERAVASLVSSGAIEATIEAQHDPTSGFFDFWLYDEPFYDDTRTSIIEVTMTETPPVTATIRRV